MASDEMDQSATLNGYRNGPVLLEKAISGLSETDLDLSLSSSSWTIRMVVHHVADGDEIWKSFIRQAIGDIGGEFKLQWYWQIPQDVWAEQWQYAQRAIEPSLAVFRANRTQTLQMIEHVPDAMSRRLLIRWPNGEEQEVGVGWVMEMQTQHVLGHVSDIGSIRKAFDI